MSFGVSDTRKTYWLCRAVIFPSSPPSSTLPSRPTFLALMYVPKLLLYYHLTLCSRFSQQSTHRLACQELRTNPSPQIPSRRRRCTSNRFGSSTSHLTYVNHPPRLLDFLPRQTNAGVNANKPLLFWLVRRVEVIRGRVPIRVECCPAFDYARQAHETQVSIPLP